MPADDTTDPVTQQSPTTFELTLTADGVVGNTNTPEAQQPAASDTTSKE